MSPVAERGTAGRTEDFTRLPLMKTSMLRWNTVTDTENQDWRGMFSTAHTKMVPFEEPFAGAGVAAPAVVVNDEYDVR
jgi:hypothetical protein